MGCTWSSPRSQRPWPTSVARLVVGIRRLTAAGGRAWTSQGRSAAELSEYATALEALRTLPQIATDASLPRRRSCVDASVALMSGGSLGQASRSDASHKAPGLTFGQGVRLQAAAVPPRSLADVRSDQSKTPLLIAAGRDDNGAWSEPT